MSASDHVPIRFVRLCDIKPSPENDQLYRPPSPDDPDIVALSESIRAQGILDPLIISKDGYVVSGHRRYTAAKLAGLKKVPCRRLNIRRSSPDFLRLLREANRQRVKTREEILREEVVSIDPEDAHRALSRYREQKAKVSATTIHIRCHEGRAAISSAKIPLLNACLRIIEELKAYWPLADRQIHYQLLNNPPLIHASKPASLYRNDRASYRALIDLLTRARHEGLISYEVIADATRPVTRWDVFPEFCDSLARARETRAHALVIEAMQIADDGKNDTYVDSTGRQRVDHDNIRRSESRVNWRKWLASKLAPHIYGDRVPGVAGGGKECSRSGN